MINKKSSRNFRSSKNCKINLEHLAKDVLERRNYLLCQKIQILGLIMHIYDLFQTGRKNFSRLVSHSLMVQEELNSLVYLLSGSVPGEIVRGGRVTDSTPPTSPKISQADTDIPNSRITTFFSEIKGVIVLAVNITLDPATAHPALILSEGNRRVTLGKKSQDLPESAQRFRTLPCVLGCQVITSGRCYWEVEVKDSGAWDLGICRLNVMRTGKISIKPEDGFWAIRFYKDEYWALTSPEKQLILKERLAKVCIFLDYEDGLLSFYNMTDKSHIYTFSQGSFDGSLRPFFRLWSSDSGHLTICPVPEAAPPADNLHHVLTPALGTS